MRESHSLRADAPSSIWLWTSICMMNCPGYGSTTRFGEQHRFHCQRASTVSTNVQNRCITSSAKPEFAFDQKLPCHSFSATYRCTWSQKFIAFLPGELVVDIRLQHAWAVLEPWCRRYVYLSAEIFSREFYSFLRLVLASP
jgi:hypothetical protein